MLGPYCFWQCREFRFLFPSRDDFGGLCNLKWAGGTRGGQKRNTKRSQEMPRKCKGNHTSYTFQVRHELFQLFNICYLFRSSEVPGRPYMAFTSFFLERGGEEPCGKKAVHVGPSHCPTTFHGDPFPPASCSSGDGTYPFCP